MEPICDYLMSVISAALICGLVSSILGKDGTVASIGRLICGIFLAVTVIRPLAEISVDDFTNFADGLTYDAQQVVSQGENLTADAVREIIIQRTQAYILDKAQALGATLTVEVILSADAPYAPCAVWLQGEVSPYAKTALTAMMENDLGISKEDQQWTR